jgi:hypothetical protein
MFYPCRVSQKLCPRCGAYWRCDCLVEELSFVADARCEHDWVDAVGVELDSDGLDLETAKVLVCRLCGLYAVQERV